MRGVMAPMSPRLLRPRRRLTVPGAPTITRAIDANSLLWSAPTSDGGSPILYYKIYVDDGFVDTVYGGTEWVDSCVEGLSYSVSAVNAIGEGPKSAEVVATL